ncbi:MAG: ATP synthase F1 subunit epsilon [Kordiimonadaceae bacterium]|nr:ATP synthase F1 subunit epsilon [Kordiimonadaceae bacterium]
MADMLKFDLVSPERQLFSGDVQQVVVPGDEGDFAVLPNHAPFMSVIRPGAITVTNGDETTRTFIRGGFAEVTPMGLTILAEEAILMSEVDTDKLTQEMLSTFSGLALFVSALGLFGLAAFNAERRTKEIGLRKVLGANVTAIVRLMIWQFSKPVLLANLIAWPLVYYVMDQWLKGFAERIDLSLWLFAAAGSAVLMLSWVTVMGHAVRVARRAPVTSLRHD